MPPAITRLVRRLVELSLWVTPASVVLVVFATSWPLMVLAEPASNPITRPQNYWWWFVVTVSTVGYGDLSPSTAAGHAVGAYVVVGGVATLTALFTHMATRLEHRRGRRMRGMTTVRSSEHIVVLGYSAGRTERIVDDLVAEGERGIALCAWDEVETHPLVERGVDFVKGDLTDERVLHRAGLHRARSALIDVRDDNEALTVAVSVHHVNPDLAPVVTLRDMARAPHLYYVDREIRCVQWHIPRMVVEELRDPGITQVYTALMAHGRGAMFSSPLPDSLHEVTFGTCQAALGRLHGATVVAARTHEQLLISPGWRTPLPAGTVLYYVSEHRLGLDEIATAVDGSPGDAPTS